MGLTVLHALDIPVSYVRFPITWLSLNMIKWVYYKSNKSEYHSFRIVLMAYDTMDYNSKWIKEIRQYFISLCFERKVFVY